jgi:hypothetical protein
MFILQISVNGSTVALNISMYILFKILSQTYLYSGFRVVFLCVELSSLPVVFVDRLYYVFEVRVGKND